MSTETYEPEVLDEDETRQLSTNSGALAELTGSEIEQQISVARRYPRSIRTFQREAKEMVTLSEEIAGECMYALPRAGKKIEGPSARFAEVIASAYGNCRAGARTIAEDDKFVTAMGFFFDTQRNVAITYEVKRRITDSKGKRFGDDMIGVTANAACSIALRNAILKGVPKAFWKGLYDEARKCAIGDVETLGERRTKMLAYFAKLGAPNDKVFALLEVAGEADITLDHLAQLKGLATAIKDGETNIDSAFDLGGNKGGATKGAPITAKKETPKEPAKEQPKERAAVDPKEGEALSDYWVRAMRSQPTLETLNAVWAEAEADQALDVADTSHVKSHYEKLAKGFA